MHPFLQPLKNLATIYAFISLIGLQLIFNNARAQNDNSCETLSLTIEEVLIVRNTVALVARAQGGTPPYSYSWQPNGSPSQIIFPDPLQESYTVTVTDGNGCIAKSTYTTEGAGEPKPNLILSAISLSGPEIEAGEAVTISFKVQNTEETESGATQASVAIYDQNRVNLTTSIFEVPPLTSEEYLVTTDYSIPQNLSPQDINIIVTVDPFSTVAESVEIDNEAIASLKVLPLPQDIGISSLNIDPGTAKSGDDIRISAVIENLGAGSVGEIILAYQLKNESGSILTSTQRSIPRLPSERSVQAEAIMTIPELSEGTYYVEVYAEIVNGEDEQPTDNTIRLPITVQDNAAIPDLSFSSLGPNTAQITNLGLDAFATIENKGDISSETFDLKFFLSNSADRITKPESPLLSVTLDPLAPGEFKTQRIDNLPLSKEIPSDCYFIYGQISTERDKDFINNTFLLNNGKFCVTPDLELERLVAEKGEGPYLLDESLILSYKISNRGNQDAGAFEMEFLYGESPDINEAVFFDKHIFQSLEATESFNAVQELELPVKTIGQFYLFARLSLTEGENPTLEPLENNQGFISFETEAPCPLAIITKPAGDQVNMEAGKLKLFEALEQEEASYSWYMDGSLVGTGRILPLRIPSEGVKILELEVEKSCGIAYDRVQISVGDTTDCPVFRVDFVQPTKTLFSVGESIPFESSSCDDCAYFWDFGDGNSARGITTSHAFSSAGRKTVLLTAVNSCGSIFVNDYILTVKTAEDCPEFRVDFEQPSKTNFEVGEAINFTSTECENCTYVWDFGDGNSATGRQTTHTYANPGERTVYLTATSACGKSFTNDYILTVEANFSECPSFRVDFLDPSPKTVFEVDELISFGATECEDCISYQWDFGDGNTAEGRFTKYAFKSPGQKRVLLKAVNRCGNSFTNDYILQVNGEISCPDFRVDFLDPSPKTTFQIGENIAFSATECEDCVLYFWDFGDGTIKTGREVTHSYQETGEKVVYLTATNICGKTFTNDYVLQVEPKPCPVFRVDFAQPTEVLFEENEVISFEVAGCDDCSYSWDFGDGNTATGNPVDHSFSSSGNKTVLVTATNSCGNTFSNDYELTIQEIDICPDFRVDFSSPTDTRFQIEEDISFEVFGCDDCTYFWDFGDGTVGFSNPIDHRFNQSGTFRVVVNATNSCGKVFTNDYELTIEEPASCPTFRVDFSQPTGTSFSLNENIPFEVFGCDDCTYAWNFGDGNTATGNPVNHSFSSSGNKTVLVTATNSCGNTFTNDYGLTIEEPASCPTFRVDFSQPTATSFSLNENIPFEVFGCDDCTYAWNFGDGNTATGNPVNHSFSSSGNKTVLVTATNSCGNTFTNDYGLTIEEPASCPTFRVDFSKPTGTSFSLNENIPFEVFGCDDCTYAWNFGDGNTATGNPVNHSFSSSGNKTVLVTATNSCGNTFTNDYGLSISSSINPVTQSWNDLISFKLYPNPAEDYVNIMLNNVDTPAELSLMDIQGKVLQQSAIYRGFLKLDISALSSGVYHLTIKHGEQHISTKLIKQ